MRCPKCGGLMNFETFVNVDVESIPWHYEGCRCIDCGEIIDPIILRNRARKTKSQEKLVEVGSHHGENE